MSFVKRWPFILLLFCAWPAHSADWPQWRGPFRSGRVAPGVLTPEHFLAELKIVWRTRVGDGLASPVVAGGKVFYLDNQQGRETLHAADAADGHESWSAPLDEAFKDIQSASGPRCTPLVDDGRIYAQSCKGELQCRSATDGKLNWRANYSTDFHAVFIGEKGNAQGAARHGYNGSPAIDGNQLVALAGGTNGAGVVCFEKTTGQVLWTSQSDPAAYAAPMIATIAGLWQAVCFTAEGVIGLEMKTGKLLWRVPVKTTFSRHVTTPVIIDDLVLVASHEAGLLGIRISRDASSLKARQVWASKESAMNFSSPVAVGNFVYGLGPARDLICLDAITGKQTWAKEGYFSSSPNKAHASFLVMGENILVLTDGGELVLMAADPKEFREISRAQVCGFTWCNPAYAGGKLFLRDARELLCVALVP